MPSLGQHRVAKLLKYSPALALRHDLTVKLARAISEILCQQFQALTPGHFVPLIAVNASIAGFDCCTLFSHGGEYGKLRNGRANTFDWLELPAPGR